LILVDSCSKLVEPVSRLEGAVSIHFYVEKMKQKTVMTCVPTAVWMVHRWYLDKIGLKNNDPIYDSIVNATPTQINTQERRLNQVGDSHRA
jgi:hypothetical protein